MTLRRVRPNNLCRAHKLILQKNKSTTRSLFCTSTKQYFHRDPNYSNSSGQVATSTINFQQQLQLLEQTNKLRAQIPTQNHAVNVTDSNNDVAASKALNTDSPTAKLGDEPVPDTARLKASQNEEHAPPTITTHNVTRNWKEVTIEPFRPFAAIWLRDNCQCSSCIHPLTRQRMVDTFAIPKDVYARSIEKGPKDTVNVWWSDNHTGVYPISWLERHQQPLVQRRSRKILRFRKFKHRRVSDEHPSVNYKDVMETGEGLIEWLQQIVDWGYCLVKGVPVDPGATKQLLERIAFIRETHYGGFWDFTSDLTYKDTAYTSEALGPHTDNTYFSDPARLQLFHLLSHTEGQGGETLLVDGFYAAYRMLSENPKGVQAFTDFAQPWHSSGNDDVCIQPYTYFPVFERDLTTARLLRIRWNNYDRAAKIDWTFHMAASWYSAARNWNAIIHRKDQTQKWLQLEPGTALIFDNWRMLHGRSEFTGKRRLCGGYINNDDFVSRYLLLKNGREGTLNALGSFASRLTV